MTHRTLDLTTCSPAETQPQIITRSAIRLRGYRERRGAWGRCRCVFQVVAVMIDIACRRPSYFTTPVASECAHSAADADTHWVSSSIALYLDNRVEVAYGPLQERPRYHPTVTTSISLDAHGHLGNCAIRCSQPFTPPPHLAGRNIGRESLAGRHKHGAGESR
ncbi:hypothetical protein PLICRDRAFT_610582 [Plicaturopsis crispa FD-325 SS-3]|nr:hypothetical protein PLICRDRAFT_610582 [Plicaturopsis crispa FD-325 SS-3]